MTKLCNTSKCPLCVRVHTSKYDVMAFGIRNSSAVSHCPILSRTEHYTDGLWYTFSFFALTLHKRGNKYHLRRYIFDRTYFWFLKEILFGFYFVESFLLYNVKVRFYESYYEKNKLTILKLNYSSFVMKYPTKLFYFTVFLLF